jgi:ADP-ribose pyrophosphatase YjhB (NUDIX family)
MTFDNHAYFQVAAKAIVKKGDEILLLFTNDGYFDFPGGRMDESEVELSLHEVLSRELAEELGTNFKFEIKNIAFVAKRKYHKQNKMSRIIAVFFEVNFLDGEIVLSDEHLSSKWISPEEILSNPDKFISEDEFEQYSAYVKRS